MFQVLQMCCVNAGEGIEVMGRHGNLLTHHSERL